MELDDNLEATNFYNIEVITNDHQNFIIKKNSIFNLRQFCIFAMTFFLLPLTYSFFINIILEETKEEVINITTILIATYINSVILATPIFILYCLYIRQGRYIVIDSLQILISKLHFIKSKPSKPNTIEIDRNMTIGINKIKYPFKKMNQENNNFEVVVYQDNDFNFKTKSKVLIDKITQSEAKYIVQKICYLANKNNEKKLNCCNDIQIKKRNPLYKIGFVILFIVLFNFGMYYAISEITKIEMYTIKNPEILDSHVLRNLGYIQQTLGSWKKNNQHVESIIIPDSYEYRGQKYYIKKIAKECFKNSIDLETISIPASITSIGKEAFDHCFSLELQIPDSVTEIGENAFRMVKHIEYHGNAKGTPWGARSMN